MIDHDAPPTVHLCEFVRSDYQKLFTNAHKRVCVRGWLATWHSF